MILPLILKWQPVFNDILSQLKSNKVGILPNEYSGLLKPEIIVFEQVVEGSHVAVITNISTIGENMFFNIAIARSGYKAGMPLSLLHSALKREKFGGKSWRDQLDRNNELRQKAEKIDETSIVDQITLKLEKVIDGISLLNEDQKFDLGKVLSLK